MKKLVFATAISTLGINAIAEGYQFSLGTLYTQYHTDGSSTNLDAFTLFGEIHFDKVSTANGPLGESAFLDKSSFVGVAYDKFSAGDYDDEDASLFTRAVLSEKIILQGFYGGLDSDDPSSYAVGIGAYITDTHDIVLNYLTSEGSDDYDLSASVHGYIGSTTSGFSYDLGLGYSDADLDDSDSATSINLGGDYYFTREFSIGAHYQFLTDGEYDSSSYTASAEWFVLPKVSLSALYNQITLDGDFFDPDQHAIQIGAEVRI